MLQPIGLDLLRQVTGGSARLAARSNRDHTAMLQMMIASMQSALQAATNKPNPMAKILPAMIAMKKGDKKGAMMALLGGGGDAKPA